MKDFRYAIRNALLNPGFTAIAVLSLALGIGLNTAIFTLIDSIILKQLPVEDPDRLVLLSDPDSAGVSIGTQGGERSLFTNQEFQRLRAGNQVFSGMFAAESSNVRVDARIEGGNPEELRPRLVAGDYFSTLGVRPILGRVFDSAGETAPGSDPYIVISYPFWKRRFGLEANVLGKSVRIQKAFLTVIGVAPPGFFGETVGDSPDGWVPMMMEPQMKPGRDWLHDDPAKAERVEWLLVGARLKPGITRKQAESSVNVLFQQVIHEGLGSNLPPDRLREIADQRIRVRPGGKGASSMRGQFNEPLLVLMVVVGMVLLIACANVANLLLAKATARQREIGIRIALGATRGRLIRQLLAESFLLAVLGGALGALLAFWAGHLLLRMVSNGPNPVPLDVHPDLRMLGFTAAISLATGLLFGLVPAIRSTRLNVSATLKENSRGVTGGGARMNLGKILVISQVATSLLLLIGAGLFLRTLRNLEHVDVGYTRENLLQIRIDGISSGYQPAARAAVFRSLLARFRSIPGVRSVTLSENGLFTGTESRDEISVEGYKLLKKDDAQASFDQIGPGYFTSLGIPLLRGRDIDERDNETGPKVCIVNESMARFYFGAGNPIGKHVTDEFPDTRETFCIVGVSRDDRDHRLRGEIPRRFYVPFFQALGGIPANANFEIRTFADPNSLIKPVRREVEQVDRTLPILNVLPVAESIDRTLTQERLIAQLSAFFGGLALLLASVGLYGVLSYSVARRTNEIGIRMALGAQQGSVVGMVLRETLVVTVIGVVIGIPAAYSLTRLVSSRLYGLSAMDPVTVAVACSVLLCVAVLAGYLPARRASRVDPLVALRYE